MPWAPWLILPRPVRVNWPLTIMSIRLSAWRIRKFNRRLLKWWKIISSASMRLHNKSALNQKLTSKNFRWRAQKCSAVTNTASGLKVNIRNLFFGWQCRFFRRCRGKPMHFTSNPDLPIKTLRWIGFRSAQALICWQKIIRTGAWRWLKIRCFMARLIQPKVNRKTNKQVC